MAGYAHTDERRLPRGWSHLALQFALWFGFYAAYQVARGAADRGIGEAFWNGTLVIEAENKVGALFEPAVQRFVESSQLLIAATSFTYWLSQFAVVGLTLLWVYFRHHERFADFRNWLIGANLAGLIGYVLMPTAPPRMFPEWGFQDTVAQFTGIHNPDEAKVSVLFNPYAAVPSMHVAFSLMIGWPLARLVRWRALRAFWFAYPFLVTFVIVATANHFLADAALGAAVAAISAYSAAWLARARPEAWRFGRRPAELTA